MLFPYPSRRKTTLSSPMLTIKFFRILSSEVYALQLYSKCFYSMKVGIYLSSFIVVLLDIDYCYIKSKIKYMQSGLNIILK